MRIPHIAALLLAFGTAHAREPASAWTADMERWAMYYYLDPRPELAIAHLDPLAEAGRQGGRSMADLAYRGGIRSFYAEIFKSSDATVQELERALPSLPDDTRTFALEALRRCGSAECRRVLGDDRPAVAEPLSPTSLDDAWASFMATGDAQHVEFVIEALPLANVRGDTGRLMIGTAAQWSLASNAHRHTRVLQICERALGTADDELRPLLQKIVDGARRDRSASPPREPAQ